MKKTVVLCFVILFCACSNSDDPVIEQNFNKRSDFNIIGHRGGVRSNTDNSILALNEAINRKYNMAEIDVQFTSDGVPIIHHNNNLSDLYSNETTAISSLKFEEIENIKNINNGVLPRSLEEFASISNGKIGFLLDFKGNYQSSLYNKCIEIFNNHNITNIKVAWSKSAKDYYYQKENFKIGVNYLDFSRVYTESSFSAKDYFLIVSSFEFNSALLQKALDLNVEIVVSVNQWNYKQRGVTSTTIIKSDIDKMIDTGVRGFLIDDIYESLFNFKD